VGGGGGGWVGGWVVGRGWGIGRGGGGAALWCGSKTGHLGSMKRSMRARPSHLPTVVQLPLLFVHKRLQPLHHGAPADGGLVGHVDNPSVKQDAPVAKYGTLAWCFTQQAVGAGSWLVLLAMLTSRTIQQPAPAACGSHCRK